MVEVRGIRTVLLDRRILTVKKSTIILHETLIRLAKGMIKAWEKWLNDIKEQQKQV